MANLIIVRPKVKMQKQKSEYLDVIITDFTVDTAKPRKPKSLGRMFTKAMQNQQPGRAYTTSFKDLGNGEMEIAFDLGPEFQKLEEKAKAEGKKLRLLYSRDGIPVFPGTSTLEHLRARKNKI